MTHESQSKVLVLNRGYQPVAICGVRRAFGLLCAGVAHALDEDMAVFDFDSWSAMSVHAGEDVIRTARRAFKIPRVLVLQGYDRIPCHAVRFSRQNVYARDGFTCQYCGQQKRREELNLDHVVPRAQGGVTSWENIVCSCVPCNTKKGARTPQQAGMTLRQKPRRPTVGRLWPRERPLPFSAWRPFLSSVDASYWNAQLEQGE